MKYFTFILVLFLFTPLLAQPPVHSGIYKVYSRAYIVQGEKWEPPVGTLNYDFVNFKDINTIILTMSRDGKKNDYQEIILKKQSGSSYQSIGSDWGYKIEIIQQSDGKLKLIMRSTEDATTVITLLLRK